MNTKLQSYIQSTIYSLFLILAIATPLIFTPLNTELFEVPKMHFVYAVSTVLLFLALTKFILVGKIIIPKHSVVYLFAAFVLIQVFSTFFSIDKFTSVFGYPSRLNGSLLSQFAYLIIFSSALISLSKDQVKKIFVAVTISASAVALWGIPSYFGKDPTCLVLTGEIASTCWKQDFQPTLRIFSTLGQPNWLASYLVLILPISFSLYIVANTSGYRSLFFLSSTAIYWSIFLTNSRAGIIGLAISGAIFLMLLKRKYLPKLIPIFITFVLITLVFSKNLQSRIKSALFTSEISKVANIQNQEPQYEHTTQTALETDGTESSQIRLVIWQGALNTVEEWPILGSGPETFVSSYFIHRPDSHNQTSEWEFFYNKAHNEFINYLANNGIIGLLSYIALIVSILWKLFQFREKSIFVKAALASLTGYFTTIFFGFSVVATQTAAFLIIAVTFIYIKPVPVSEYKFKIKKKFHLPAVLLICLIGLFALSFTFRSYLSNVYEKRAENFKSQNPQRELIAYTNAINTHFVKNPYLLAEYSMALATSSALASDLDSKFRLANHADGIAKETLRLSPNNFLIAQRVARTYALLATENKNYHNQAKEITQKLIELAPNYPITYLTSAKIEIIMGNYELASGYLEKTLQLKPDYLEARQLLDQVEAEILQ